jgi:hypothetical protein
MFGHWHYDVGFYGSDLIQVKVMFTTSCPEYGSPNPDWKTLPDLAPMAYHQSFTVFRGQRGLNYHFSVLSSLFNPVVIL